MYFQLGHLLELESLVNGQEGNIYLVEFTRAFWGRPFWFCLENVHRGKKCLMAVGTNDKSFLELNRPGMNNFFVYKMVYFQKLYFSTIHICRLIIWIFPTWGLKKASVYFYRFRLRDFVNCFCELRKVFLIRVDIKTART